MNNENLPLYRLYMCVYIPVYVTVHIYLQVQLLESRAYQKLGNIMRSRAALTSAKTTANGIYCPPKLQASLDLQSGEYKLMQEGTSIFINIEVCWFVDDHKNLLNQQCYVSCIAYLWIINMNFCSKLSKILGTFALTVRAYKLIKYCLIWSWMSEIEWAVAINRWWSSFKFLELMQA